MKPPKLIVSLTAAVCALAVCNVHAQITNIVTFSATTFTQGQTNDNGTITTLGPTATASRNTTQLLEELSPILAPGTGLSKAAKLVLITGHEGANFAVIDGANFYDLSPSGLKIMGLSFPGENQITAGKQADDSPLKSTTQLQLITLTYDDGKLQFALQGLGTITQTDTTPVKGIYTETTKAKIADMTGEGSSGSGPFVATGSLSISGKGELSVPPPS
jgi:hypothetical protein